MNTELAKTNGTSARTIESVLLQGDLRNLTPELKLSYYQKVCDTLGLNPYTQPFAYIVLNGKETLYAKRDATEQLRKIHGVSITILARELVEDLYIVTARATDKTGRSDESVGAVNLGGLKGDNRANAIMKAETKAKRRVTLSICGLGLLDETEVETIPGAHAPVTGPAATLPEVELGDGYKAQLEPPRTTIEPLENPWLHKMESGVRDKGKFLYQMDASKFASAQRAFLQERISEADYVNMLACLENPHLREAALEEISEAEGQ